MVKISVYFDTEFSDCDRADAALISVGFTIGPDTPESDIYIELADGWSHDQVSYFVEETVLPLLGRFYPEILRRSAAAARIEEWIDELRGGNRSIPIELISDSEWDWALLNSLYYPGWSAELNVTFRMRPFSELQESLITEYFELNGLTAARHHALVDARGLQYAASKIKEIMKSEGLE